MKHTKIFRILTIIIILLSLMVVIPAVPAQAQTITCTPSSGPPGTIVTVYGTGFTGYTTSYAYILFNYSYIQYAEIASDGTISTSFTIPSTAPAGALTITVQHTDSVYSPTYQIAITYFTVTRVTVGVTPSSANVGETVTVSGSGFTGATSVIITFDTVSVGTTTTLADGSFTATFTVPESYWGTTHKVKATDSSGKFNEAAFTIIQKITATPAAGGVGDQINISGTGFSPSQGITFYFDNLGAGNTMSNAVGSFNYSTFTVPSGSRGSHTIKAQDASFHSATAVFEVAPQMVVSPASGFGGTTAAITGTGFSAGSIVSFFWDNLPVSGAVTTVTTVGAITLSNFPISYGFGGSHTIKAQDASGYSATGIFTIKSQITITPTTGGAGIAVAVTGNGFKASSPITIKYNGVPVTTSPVAISADASGSFSGSFNVPVGGVGTFPVEASDGTYSSTADFQVTFNATISQTTSESSPGYVGMNLTINGTGFKPNATVTVTFTSEPIVLATTTTDASGAFSVTFPVPAGVGGEHTITATDGNYTKQFTFFMESTPPPIPVPLLPEMGVKADSQAQFDWQDVTDPSGVTYSLQIASDKDFTTMVLEKKTLTTSEYTLTKEEKLKSVSKDTPYYWWVRAIDGASNEGAWTAAGSFYAGFQFAIPQWAIYALAGIGALLLMFFGFWLGRKTAYSRYY